MRLLDGERHGGFRLRQAALSDDAVKPQCEMRLGEFLLGMMSAKVGEDDGLDVRRRRCPTRLCVSSGE